MTTQHPAHPRDLTRRLCVIGAAIAVTTCGGFVGEAFVSRRATLVARIVTSDGRVGVPCTITGLIFGQEEGRAEAAAGADTRLVVGMMTPAKVQSPVKASAALRVACQGYPSATSEERDIEVSVLNPPTVDFGTITVAAAKQ